MSNIKAVKMMRDIRDRITDKYLKDRDSERKELQKIRKKYGIKERKVRSYTHSK